MNIGYFFDNYESANEYATSLFELISRNDDSAVLKERSLTIESFGNRMHFIVIKNFKDVNKISGMVFDAVFLKSVFTTDIDRYVLSRFRPRCSCQTKLPVD